ncbi:hypothetical protein KGA66_23250 [Actinocrinis puniceicyclus]|uniref:VWFA domain-containing protein n=1 Tax=Actinocrinis puniceicyclus TaxID=977794 RepID=A0A8J7WT32_9ACTN|nr:hypothetical protein [Actinocrinis puniceicyclus]MBS2965982.1 hypothetical protein [Actinocrinis puniceicyclus]
MTTDSDYSPDVIRGEVRLKCLPTYIVLDTSSSMNDHVELLNKSLQDLHKVTYQNPEISEFAHISIIVFNTEAHLALPMSDISQVTQLPRVGCGGRTEYAKVFERLRERIDIDVPALRAADKLVLRPAVFFMTDGAPTDGFTEQSRQTDERIWKAALSRLVDPDWERHPHVVTFGFGSANEHVLGTVATLQAFIAEDGADQSDALTDVFTFLLRTLSISATRNNFVVPTAMEGYRAVELEEIS